MDESSLSYTDIWNIKDKSGDPFTLTVVDMNFQDVSTVSKLHPGHMSHPSSRIALTTPQPNKIMANLLSRRNKMHPTVK